MRNYVLLLLLRFKGRELCGIAHAPRTVTLIPVSKLLCKICSSSFDIRWPSPLTPKLTGTTVTERTKIERQLTEAVSAYLWAVVFCRAAERRWKGQWEGARHCACMDSWTQSRQMQRCTCRLRLEQCPASARGSDAEEGNSDEYDSTSASQHLYTHMYTSVQRLTTFLQQQNLRQDKQVSK